MVSVRPIRLRTAWTTSPVLNAVALPSADAFLAVRNTVVEHYLALVEPILEGRARKRFGPGRAHPEGQKALAALRRQLEARAEWSRDRWIGMVRSGLSVAGAAGLIVEGGWFDWKAA